MRRYVNAALILSIVAVIGVFFISSLFGIICGVISIVLSLARMKTEKKKSMIAIAISTIAILLSVILALMLAYSLDGF